MRYISVFSTLAAPLLASAAPARFYGKRAANDVLVFQFADVLEQLESSFYSQAISKFQDADFIAAGYSSSQLPVQQFQNIQSDEATHSQVLQAALQSLGGAPITGCNFDFSSVLTDVSTMAATARVVENLGVSAYLGGATLLTDPVLLDSAGSILTVEARHQTILNVLSSTGSAIPAAFDIAFTPGEVLAVASPFVSGCTIPIPANTPLTVTNTGTVAPGTLLTFEASTINGTIPESSMFCQMLIGGNPMSIPIPLSQCVVPDGINGPVALFVTSDGNPLINNVRDRAQNKIVAGPTVAFIDTKPELLGQVARTGSGSGSQSTSTLTISPAQASSIVASAGASVTGSADPAATSSPSSSSSDPNAATSSSASGAIIVNGWSTSSTSSSSNSSNLTSGSSAAGNVASASDSSTTVSSAAAVATSSSSSPISVQASAAVVNTDGASATASAAATAATSSTSSSTSSSSGSAGGAIVVNGWNTSSASSASSSSSSSSSPAVVVSAGGASTTGSVAAVVVNSSSSASNGPSANGSIVVKGWNTGSSS